MINLLLILAFATNANAKVVIGDTMLVANDANILTKFVFDYMPNCLNNCDHKPGIFKVHVGPMDGVDQPVKANQGKNEGMYMVLYDDQMESFEELRAVWDKVSCNEKMEFTKAKELLPPQAFEKGGYSFEIPITQQIRYRWWYIGFLNCWRQHYSMDRRWVLHFCLIFALGFGYLAWRQNAFQILWQDMGRRKIPFAVALVSSVVTIHAIALTMMALHWIIYANDGIGLPKTFLSLGRLIQLVSRQMIILLLLLISRGAAVISKSGVSKSGSVRYIIAEHSELVLTNAAFLIGSFLLESWSDYSYERHYVTDYVYDTKPGMILMTADLCWFFKYCKDLYKTRSQLQPESASREFYMSWGPVFSLYFLALPVVWVVGHFVDPWCRYGAVIFASNMTQFAACVGLLKSLDPKTAYKYFADDGSPELQGLFDEPFDML